jgi:hypothetical protein
MGKVTDLNRPNSRYVSTDGEYCGQQFASVRWGVTLDYHRRNDNRVSTCLGNNDSNCAVTWINIMYIERQGSCYNSALASSKLRQTFNINESHFFRTVVCDSLYMRLVVNQKPCCDRHLAACVSAYH